MMKRIATSLFMVLFVAMCCWAQSGADIMEKYKQNSGVQYQDVTEMVKGAGGTQMVEQMAQANVSKEALDLFVKRMTKMQVLVVMDKESAQAIGKDMAELKGYEIVEKNDIAPGNPAMPDMKMNAKFYLKVEGDTMKEMVAMVDMGMMAVVCLIEGSFEKEEIEKMFINTNINTAN